MGIPNIKVILFGILLPMICAIPESDMEVHCGSELSISSSAYQLELELTDNSIYSSEMSTCEVVVKTWDITYTKLMFYFDDLDLDCDDGHLEFFDGQNNEVRVTGTENKTCGDNTPHGVFIVGSQYLQIKYVPRRNQFISDVFSIIITAFTTFSNDTCPSYAYKCANSRCISKDIACNGYNSCGDGSVCDDDSSNDDHDDDHHDHDNGNGGNAAAATGSDDDDNDGDSEDKDEDVAGTIIGAIIGSLAILALIACIIFCCICRNRKTGKTDGIVQYQQSPIPTTAAYTTSGQRLGYSQQGYGINHATPYQTNQAYDVAHTGVLQKEPIPTVHQVNFQAPVPSGGQFPLSPPPYSDIFGQPDQGPPHSGKQEHVYAELDDTSGLHTYDNAKQAS